MNDLTETKEILARTDVVVHPERFAILGLSQEQWGDCLLAESEFIRSVTTFAIFQILDEVTMIVEHEKAAGFEKVVDGSRIAWDLRLLTFDVELDFSIVGFMAEISRILAEAGISILPIAGFSRDHLFIADADLPVAIKALRPFVRVMKSRGK